MTTETKEERPPSSAEGGSQTQQESEFANLNSLATLNLLHQQVWLGQKQELILLS
jgi:hypothetical protein